MDPSQRRAIDEHMQNKLLDTTMLNQLISKRIKQHGAAVDADDTSRLLDGRSNDFLSSLECLMELLGMILEKLTDRYMSSEEHSRARTVDNYATKKLHLNTFMNAVREQTNSQGREEDGEIAAKVKPACF